MNKEDVLVINASGQQGLIEAKLLAALQEDFDKEAVMEQGYREGAKALYTVCVIGSNHRVEKLVEINGEKFKMTFEKID